MGLKKTPEYVREIRDELRSEPVSILSDKKIQAAVEKILSENKITCPPVNVFKLAKELEFDVFSFPFDPKEGVIGFMGDGPTDHPSLKSKRFIGVQESGDDIRVISTMGHEFGHFFIDCNSSDQKNYMSFRYIGRSDAVNPVLEINADAFKNELLMPYKLLGDFLKDKKGTRWDALLEEIKKTFLVSRHVAREHLENILKKPIVNEAVYEGDFL